MIYRPFDSSCAVMVGGFESRDSSRPHPHHCCCCCPVCCCHHADHHHSPPTVNVLTAINSAAQTPTVNAALTFAENPTLIGTAISHSSGSSSIVIHTPGVYQVSFHATVSPTANTEVPHRSILQLLLNGISVPSAVATHLSINTADASTIGFSYIFAVTTVPVTLTVQSQIANTSIAGAAINVTRIGSVSSDCTTMM